MLVCTAVPFLMHHHLMPFEFFFEVFPLLVSIPSASVCVCIAVLYFLQNYPSDVICVVRMFYSFPGVTSQCVCLCVIVFA